MCIKCSRLQNQCHPTSLQLERSEHVKTWLFESLQRRSDTIKSGDRLEDITTLVSDVFNNYPLVTLEQMWQSLLTVLDCVLEAQSGNDYHLPHCRKELAQRCGKVERTVLVKGGGYLGMWGNFEGSICNRLAWTLNGHRWCLGFWDVVFWILILCCNLEVHFIFILAFSTCAIYSGTDK